MAQAQPQTKALRPSEMTFAGGLFLFAMFAVFVAAKAYEPAYAFHAALFAAAAAAGSFAIVNRYFERPAERPPQVIDGKPNYNFGPVKFATVAAIFWGVVGFSVGLYIALEMAFPLLNFDLPWIAFGRLRPGGKPKPAAICLTRSRVIPKRRPISWKVMRSVLSNSLICSAWTWTADC